MLLAKNRKALFNYEVVHKYIAGIQLYGYEVKAIREGKVSFEGAYVDIIDGGAFIVNLYVGRYSHQSQELSETQQYRRRRLLLNKSEILKISSEINQKGKTAVPLAFVVRNNLIKLEFAVVKGRKKFEKKAVAKERQQKLDLARETKEMKRVL